MAETLGSLADKISIIQLKRYHMSEQLARRGLVMSKVTKGGRPPKADKLPAGAVWRAQVNSRLKILAAQKKDLENEFTALFYAYAAKKAVPKIYRQFKMYNDPKYRSEVRGQG